MFYLTWLIDQPTPWGAVRRLPKLPGDRDDSWHYTYKPSGSGWVKWVGHGAPGMVPKRKCIGSVMLFSVTSAIEESFAEKLPVPDLSTVALRTDHKRPLSWEGR